MSGLLKHLLTVYYKVDNNTLNFALCSILVASFSLSLSYPVLKRLQLLEPFNPWDGKDIEDAPTY